MSFNLRPDLKPAPSIKPLINVGASFDIPNGTWLVGTKGETILSGGLSMIVGVVGIGNNFKTTIMDYMKLRGAARLNMKYLNTYDTEINVHEERKKEIAARIEEWLGVDIIDAGTWVISDKRDYYANEWYAKYKEFMKAKRTDAKRYMRDTPFMNREKNGYFQVIEPTATSIDSFTDFETEDVADMSDKGSIGDSKRNTAFMRQGISKLQFISELPALVYGSNNYILMTAQLGKEIVMDAYAPPNKKLQYLKNNDKLMGVTSKFTYLTHDCYNCYNASPLMNQGTKGPEYPKTTSLELVGDTDLNSVMIRNLRGKSGRSGMTLEIIVSQTEGVLPSLTEFHYIKTYDRYGISGSVQHYALDIYPDVKISRTTVREKIDRDFKLRRALNITCEMCQMYQYMSLDAKYVCTPAQLYEDLTKLGYNWDLILTYTRGWWTLIGEHEDSLFLSTMDLLKIRAGEYFPYWMNEDKTIKEEYLVKLKRQ